MVRNIKLKKLGLIRNPAIKQIIIKKIIFHLILLFFLIEIDSVNKKIILKQNQKKIT